MNPELTFALELADAADAITLARFRAADLVVETKPDMTPVSEADKAVEAALRSRINRARPGHGIVGEEMGSEGTDKDVRWIIDPIDATKNYIRGVPVFATLIALEREDRVEVGVVSAPGLGRRWWAARGEGAFASGQPIRVSRVAKLSDAFFLYSSIHGWEERGRGAQMLELLRRVWRSRAFGDFWAHMLVAEGAADLAAEPEVTLWDLAALQVILEEAGGRFTDRRAQARPDGGSALSSNGLLHDELLAALGDG
jgi:histidinol-phosphatase